MGNPVSMENIKQEVYVSVDVETDGPIPGPHSMLSLGAVAMLPNDNIDHREIGCFRDRKSTRLNSSHSQQSRMPSSA